MPEFYAGLTQSYIDLADTLRAKLPATGDPALADDPEQAGDDSATRANTALSAYEVRDAAIAREGGTVKCSEELAAQASGEAGRAFCSELVALAQMNKSKLDAARID